MADDLTRPYIGYRSAGRRPERQQDRRAAADAPLAALRGMISGVAGAPGDIESLVRMLPGLSEQTVLPTSEDIERRLPLRSVSETPAGRAFTTAGQLGGGFYAGPGSPLRAIAALPSAVSRAGRDFAMAAGQPAVNVVKPKGGNWLAGSVEGALKPMLVRGPTHRDEALMIGGEFARLADTPEGIEQMAKNEAINKWLQTKLAKYIRNEMGTPEDPIRALAEKGVIHSEITPTGYNVARARRDAGFPEEGMGVSPLAKTWEDRADTFINPLKASDMTRGLYPQAVEANPWLLKVPPETPVYEMLSGSEGQFGGLGFGHLADELKNAINPASGLPENLRWKYQDLEKVTVPQAVQRVADINAWRAAQKVEADMARAMGPATHVFKEYPEQGFKWVELKAPKETGRKISVEKPEMDLPPDYNEAMGREVAMDMAYDEGLEEGTREFNDFVRRTMEDFGRKKKVEIDESYKALEDALRYEGETMGHCVGGYCEDVASGQSRIFSLRDKKGQPHVTIETRPMENYELEAAKMKRAGASPEEIAAFFENPPQEIVQIKGKANRAPNPEYLPAVQDFVRSQKWDRVGDIQNTGLRDISTWRDQVIDQGADPAKAEAFFSRIPGGYATKDELDQLMGPLGSDYTFSRLAKFINGEPLEGGTGLTPGARGEGFAAGGLVDDASGANFPTDDFDPDRIDSIVGDLHALNAG